MIAAINLHNLSHGAGLGMLVALSVFVALGLFWLYWTVLGVGVAIAVKAYRRWMGEDPKRLDLLAKDRPRPVRRPVAPDTAVGQTTS